MTRSRLDRRQAPATAFTASTVPTPSKKDFVVDSGCSSHIVTDLSLMKSLDLEAANEEYVLHLADGSMARGEVKGRGRAMFRCTDSDGRPRDVTLNDVLFIPTFPRNILSIPSAIKEGMSFQFSKANCRIVGMSGGSLVMDSNDKLFTLKFN